MPKILIPQPLEFEWDHGNIDKNWLKHQVSTKESESIFVDSHILLYPDLAHSQTETRYLALGKSENKRYLTIIFTLRNNNIRIISARDMNIKERSQYEQQT